MVIVVVGVVGYFVKIVEIIMKVVFFKDWMNVQYIVQQFLLFGFKFQCVVVLCWDVCGVYGRCYGCQYSVD